MMQLPQKALMGMALMLCTALQVNAQWGFDEPDPLIYLDLRVDLGIMIVENQGTAGFVPTRTTAYGLHLEAGHYFDNFGVFSGVGFNLFPFRQRQVQPIGLLESERISSHTRYFSLEVPIGVSYKFGSAISVHAALKMHLMRLRNTEHNINTDGFPTNFVITASERNEMPDWQFIPEVNFGFDYDIGSRLRIAFYGGFSLAHLQGVSWDYTQQEIGEDVADVFRYDLSYSWFRYGAGLSYHIIK